MYTLVKPISLLKRIDQTSSQSQNLPLCLFAFSPSHPPPHGTRYPPSIRVLPLPEHPMNGAIQIAVFCTQLSSFSVFEIYLYNQVFCQFTPFVLQKYFNVQIIYLSPVDRHQDAPSQKALRNMYFLKKEKQSVGSYVILSLNENAQDFYLIY